MTGFCKRSAKAIRCGYTQQVKGNLKPAGEQPGIKFLLTNQTIV
jgi:hypothetical protein